MKILIELDVEQLTDFERGRLPTKLDLRLRDDTRVGAKLIDKALRQMHEEVNGIPPYSHNYSIRQLIEDIGLVAQGKEPKTFSVKLARDAKKPKPETSST